MKEMSGFLLSMVFADDGQGVRENSDLYIGFRFKGGITHTYSRC